MLGREDFDRKPATNTSPWDRIVRRRFIPEYIEPENGTALIYVRDSSLASTVVSTYVIDPVGSLKGARVGDGVIGLTTGELVPGYWALGQQPHRTDRGIAICQTRGVLGWTRGEHSNAPHIRIPSSAKLINRRRPTMT
jgi:hypothetical protein